MFNNVVKLKEKLRLAKIQLQTATKNLRKTSLAPRREFDQVAILEKELVDSEKLFCQLFAESGVNEVRAEYRKLIGKYKDCMRSVKHKSHMIQHTESNQWSITALTAPIDAFALLVEPPSYTKLKWSNQEQTYTNYIYDFFKSTTENLFNYNQPLQGLQIIGQDQNIVHAFTPGMKPSFLEELPNQQLLLPVMYLILLKTFSLFLETRLISKKSFSTKNYDFKLGPQAPKFSKLAETIEFNCYDKKLEQDIEFNALKCFKILKTKPAKILYILSMWEVIGNHHHAGLFLISRTF